MKTLYILRHGKAVAESGASNDHARELTASGALAVREVAAQLRRSQPRPELILTSTAARARHTAELCAEELAGVSLQERDDLYLAPASAYFSALREVGAEPAAVLLVGHNPGLEELALAITGRAEALGTAALVVCRLTIDHWKDLQESG